MSERPVRGRWDYAAVALGAVVALVVLGIIALNNANGTTRTALSTPTAVAATPTQLPTTPTPAPTPVPTGTPEPTGIIPFADCGAAHFGAPMAPLNQPANVHVYSAPPPMTINESKLYRMTIHTGKGDIVICLQPQLAPITVNSMVTLTRNHFYDGLIFHRVVAGFVIQGGDPTGTGSGGPGYAFQDEPVRQNYVLGAVAMANSGPNTNGSQFFIDIADDTSTLQPKYNLFGKVESGQDVANKIAQGDVMTSVTVAEQM